MSKRQLLKEVLLWALTIAGFALMLYAQATGVFEPSTPRGYVENGVTS